MQDRLRILFFCLDDPQAAFLALHLAGRLDAKLLDTACAAGRAESAASETLAYLADRGGRPAETRIPALAGLRSEPFDVVVTLSDSSLRYLETGSSPRNPPGKDVLFLGSPLYLHWPLPEPAGEEGEALGGRIGAIARELDIHLAAFAGHGYASALLWQRNEFRALLDRLEDGVIVHDSRRHIYVFNHAMERITGFAASDVLGRDCHDVFPDHGLCGGECRFKEEPDGPLGRQEYTVPFQAAEGETRQLRVVSAALPLGPARSPGVLATVRDVTEVSDLRWTLRRKRSFHGIVGSSPAMREVFDIIRQVGPSDYPVLIAGESGTGKELVAAAIHNESRRKGGPFVPINCGALPENILESELFGHVRGAFTGAIRDKKGRFELADGGTLFFDEVGELSPGFQVRLLRVLQEKSFEMVGGERSVSVDVRVLSATNRRLRDLVEEGRFREDLYYRLAVVPVYLPPLRDRREDVPRIVEKILRDIQEEMQAGSLRLADETLDCLMTYDWPGNVRELINALQYAAVRCQGELVRPRHLPPEICSAGCRNGAGEAAPAPQGGRRRKLDAVSVRRALERTGGNKVQAARMLGVGRATLYRFLKENPVS